MYISLYAAEFSTPVTEIQTSTSPYFLLTFFPHSLISPSRQSFNLCFIFFFFLFPFHPFSCLFVFLSITLRFSLFLYYYAVLALSLFFSLSPSQGSQKPSVAEFSRFHPLPIQKKKERVILPLSSIPV